MKLKVTFNVEADVESATTAQATLTAITDGIQANIPEGVLIEIADASAEITQVVDLMVEDEVEGETRY